ncbi:hypothetical protein [Piscinibacter sp. HJYY11]|uniref:hypothetical protein n=1 Tax=Piscinibacter sp. HJYY11 TaxID=2801333 RepID=UPI00191F3836|nr:hypothetical protein [Piscinibacter sp. HJYY11]MBL0729578.1 hypothetical protein [Piscinibacter sp. HJYY11]
MLSALDLGSLHYRGMELSVRLPWYIVTCKVDDDGLKLLRSFCCSRDFDLIELLKTQQGRVVASIQRLTPAPSDYGWVASTVMRVWQARDVSGDVALVTEDEHGVDSWDGALNKSVWNAEGWSLLFEAQSVNVEAG